MAVFTERWKRRLGVVGASVALAGGGVLGAVTSAYTADADSPHASTVIGHGQGGCNSLIQGGGGGNQANQAGGCNSLTQGGG